MIDTELIVNNKAYVMYVVVLYHFCVYKNTKTGTGERYIIFRGMQRKKSVFEK